MNAQDAKKLALENKAKVEQNRQIREAKLTESDVEQLIKHFEGKIENAVNRGLLQTDKISFANDRFSVDVLREVNDELRSRGFTLTTETHNAFHTINFVISWT